MSGHSKWSTIKRKKAANDAKRGNVFTRLAREIALAAREGGADTDTNFGLRLAVERARAANMPKDNIERAIRRGTGEDKDAAAFEHVLYEGYAPHGVAVLVEVVTDNRNRTVADLRHALTRAGGTMSEAGSVAWQFRRAAYFSFPAPGVDREKIFEAAVEAGADDVILGDDSIEIIAPVESFKAISDSLRSGGIKPDEAGLRMLPTTTIELPADQSLQVMRVIDSIEEMDEIQHVFSNLHVSDEAVALLETA
jgi:YebC/PmpR family DNA-binding regulatory protein